MEEWLKTICGLIGLLIGAGLLTRLTRGADQTPGRFRKRSKKKLPLATEATLLAQDDKAETDGKSATHQTA